MKVSRSEFIGLTKELPGSFDPSTERYLTDDMKSELLDMESDGEVGEEDDDDGLSILESNIVQGIELDMKNYFWDFTSLVNFTLSPSYCLSLNIITMMLC